MTDQRVGAIFRLVRTRKGWRQVDVATRAGVPPSMVSLIERGQLEKVSLPAIRRVAGVLDIRIDFDCWWRGGQVERLLNARHSALEEVVARMFGKLGGWAVVPEASFSIHGERGLD